jgi:threonine/homoserine/homoserine lactone efflux protein
MQEIIQFAIIVILISASGVMSPGPLFAANVVYGLKGGAKAGLKMAYGHTIVELPLIILIGFGILSIESFPELRLVITIAGAMGLFAFAGLHLKVIFKQKNISEFTPKFGPFLSGILLSALNPFFIIWWFTIGLKLISDSLVLWSFAGIFIMFVLHIWMDFAWLSGIAYLSSKGSRLLSNKNNFLVIGLSSIMVLFGVFFLIEIFV